MFPRLALLPIGLFIIWCFVCRQWYVCHIKQVCDIVVPPPPPPDTVDTIDTRPLVFEWSKADPITRSTFAAYRDSILASLSDNELLEIVGLYSQDEAPPQGFANMGLARGEEVKKLFAQFIPAERIVVSSELVPEPENARTKVFESIRFKKKPVAPPPPDTVECIKNQDGLTVLFPYGKAQREVDLAIEKCLEDIVEFLKANPDKKVHITGHTDDAGSKEFNMGLGMRRAEHIRAIVIKNGIQSGRISVESKGENEPVASNNTEEGSRLNRRAVLVVI